MTPKSAGPAGPAATFGRDLTVDNGFREDSRVNLRLLYAF